MCFCGRMEGLALRGILPAGGGNATMGFGKLCGGVYSFGFLVLGLVVLRAEVIECFLERQI